jgi:hypothetical protein
VQLTRADFDRLADELGLMPLLRHALLQTNDTYVSNTNSYAPFFEVADVMRSSVTLLSRFLCNWQNVCLYRRQPDRSEPPRGRSQALHPLQQDALVFL